MGRQFFLAMWCCVLTGCSGTVTYQTLHDPELRKHVVAVDGWGWPLDPGQGLKRMEQTNDVNPQIAEIFKGISDWQSSGPLTDGKPQRKRVVIFVHGGLNTQTDALQRAEDRYAHILADEVYPVFINWDTNGWSSYGEHAFAVRQGIVEPVNIPSGVFYVLADVVRAIGRAPIVWYNFIARDVDRGSAFLSANRFRDEDQDRRFTDNPSEREAVVVTSYLDDLQRDKGDRAISIKFGKFLGKARVAPVEIARGVGFYPVRLLVAPALDALGTSAWENMCRRALVMFDGEAANHFTDEVWPASRVVRPGPGVMVEFRNQLSDFQAKHPELEITLVGHSMGAIVLDELVRRSMQPGREVHYANIVYLAAACSIHDFQRCVLPYMQRQKETDVPGPTQFYNLCLHPVNDLREQNCFDLVPRGSLLVWIDELFEEPKTPLDRTMGRWDNIVQATYAIPRQMDSRVHLKAFSFMQSDAIFDEDPDTHERFLANPQQHTQFTDDAVSFWRPDFWNLPSPGTTPGELVPELVKKRAAEIARSSPHQ